jgi:hypothetical protein
MTGHGQEYAGKKRATLRINGLLRTRPPLTMADSEGENHYSVIGDTPEPKDDEEVILLCAAIIHLTRERDQLKKDMESARQQLATRETADVSGAFLPWLTSRLNPVERHLYIAVRDRRLHEHRATFDELGVIREWQDKIATAQ